MTGTAVTETVTCPVALVRQLILLLPLDVVLPCEWACTEDG